MDERVAAVEIMPLAAAAAASDAWPQIAEIFFAGGGRADYPSDAARARHLRCWTGYYRDREADLFFVARHAGDGRIVGYLTGCRDSIAATGRGLDLPAYDLFARWFERFPAHLHVNCHPAWRGAGIGRRLVNRLCIALRADGVRGLHVVTLFGARNAGFYRRCGFREIDGADFNGRQLLLLGRRP